MRVDSEMCHEGLIQETDHKYWYGCGHWYVSWWVSYKKLTTNINMRVDIDMCHEGLIQETDHEY